MFAPRIALDARECYLPLLGTAVESWHALDSCKIGYFDLKVPVFVVRLRVL